MPVWATFDSQNGYTYVMNSGWNSSLGGGTVSVLDGTVLLATIQVGLDPVSGAFDPQNGFLYVANLGSNSVSVINQTSLIGSITVGSAPTFLAYDPADSYVYVSNSNDSTVSVLNGAVALATIAVGQSPGYMTYDESDGYMYVANSGSANVSVLNATNVIGNIQVGGSPEVPAYDNRTGLVYVPDGISNVSVVRGFSVVATIPVGGSPFSATCDGRSGNMYVVDVASNQVSVINGSSKIANVNVGSAPLYALYNPADGFMYVPNRQSGDVSVINGSGVVTTVAVQVNPWMASYDSISKSVDVLNYGSASVSILELAAVFNVTFTESGLPLNANWAVSLGGAVNSSTGTTVGFIEPNGTYDYLVHAIVNYSSTPGFGTIALNGTDQDILEAFNSTWVPSYSVDFFESGLPAGTPWWTSVDGAPATVSTSVSMRLTETNGSHSYLAKTSDKNHASVNGSFQVVGHPINVSVVFPNVTFEVTFMEQGLPPGTNWSVVINHLKIGGIGSNLSTQIVNGSYSFDVSVVAGFAASPKSGVFSLSGQPLSRTIVFTPNSNSNQSVPPGESAGTSLFGLTAFEWFLALLSAVALCVVGVVLILRRKGRGGLVEGRYGDATGPDKLVDETEFRT
jgi:YVTN family beta-propeller protein